MARYRVWLGAFFLFALVGFYPSNAQSKQYFDATLRFNPQSGTRWHYKADVVMVGEEIMPNKREAIVGYIQTIFDDEVNSSGNGLVSMHTIFNTYDALDLGFADQYKDPSENPWQPPDYSIPMPDMGDDGPPNAGPGAQGPDPLQIGGGGGDPGGGGGAGGDDLAGEGAFEFTPVMESNLNWIMSESGRMLDISGMELIGDIIDPSRSITVRQIFQTLHFVVLPDYEVHLNESWRAPMSWTIPYVGETMEIPMTFTLADIRTTYRFRVAAIDFSGILQFDVDVADEGRLEDESGKIQDYRKESNIEGDIIIMGRAYVDLDRGILVGLCDTPVLGNTYFLNGWSNGGGYGPNDLGLPGPLNPGFYAALNFERRDLYTPLGNVIDPRQEVVYRIQDMQWFTTSIVE